MSAARRLPLPAPRILVAAGLAGIVFLATVLPRRAELFEMSPVEISRATYGLNPFPESREIARYLAKHSDPSDRIAVLGSEPQILFEAGRRSATGYIYMYPLMESQPLASEMQREMIAEVESARPRFLVHVHVRTSWLPRRFSPQLIFEWVREYKQEHYEIVGLVNLLAEGSEFQWGPDVVWPPSAPAWIEIWKRRG